MPVRLDVQPRLDREAVAATANELREAMTAAIRDAAEEVLFGLTLTPAEILTIKQARLARNERIVDGRQKIRSALHAQSGKTET